MEEKRVRIIVHKGGNFDIETEGFTQTGCRQMVDNVVKVFNAKCVKDEDRDSIPDDAQVVEQLNRLHV